LNSVILVAIPISCIVHAKTCDWGMQFHWWNLGLGS